jgi:hypothetical protein
VEIIYQGVTWHRLVTIQDEDDPPNPVDPTELVAVLCPEWPMTVTGPADPGVYLVTLTAEETAALPAGLNTKWEMIGVVGGDVVRLVDEDVRVEGMCARVAVGI